MGLHRTVTVAQTEGGAAVAVNMAYPHRATSSGLLQCSVSRILCSSDSSRFHLSHLYMYIYSALGGTCVVEMVRWEERDLYLEAASEDLYRHRNAAPLVLVTLMGWC